MVAMAKRGNWFLERELFTRLLSKVGGTDLFAEVSKDNGGSYEQDRPFTR